MTPQELDNAAVRLEEIGLEEEKLRSTRDTQNPVVSANAISPTILKDASVPFTRL